jgi:hypothetical protein
MSCSTAWSDGATDTIAAWREHSSQAKDSVGVFASYDHAEMKGITHEDDRQRVMVGYDISGR